jgi:hypothetical protein
MNRALTIELSTETYATLWQEAEARGTSAEDLAATVLEETYGVHETFSGRPSSLGDAARQRFERHFGEIDLGRATGADNPGIDADLAREYANDHEER